MREYGDDWRQGSRERQEPWRGQEAWAPVTNRDQWGDDDPPPPRSQPSRDAWDAQGSTRTARSTHTTQQREPSRDPRRPAQNESWPSRRTASAPQPRPWYRSKPVGPLALIVLPLLGAVVSGPDLGIVFTLACVAAALGAALLATPNGLWWIVPSTPTALLAVAFLWVSVESLTSAKTTVAVATDLFQGVAGAFPGIAAGTVGALGVAGYRRFQGASDARGSRV